MSLFILGVLLYNIPFFITKHKLLNDALYRAHSGQPINYNGVDYYFVKAEDKSIKN